MEVSKHITLHLCLCRDGVFRCPSEFVITRVIQYKGMKNKGQYSKRGKK